MDFGDNLSALLSAVSKNIEVLFHLHRCSFPFRFRQIAAISYSLLLESGPQMWSSSSARLTLTRTTQNIFYLKHNVSFAIHKGMPTCTLIIVIYKKPQFVWFFESTIERRERIPLCSCSTTYKHKRIAQDSRVSFSEAYCFAIIHSEFWWVS